MSQLARPAAAAAVAPLLLGVAPAAAGDAIAPFARDLSILWTAPFAALLLAIALLPLLAGRWWERNLHTGAVAAACALPVLVLLLVEDSRGGTAALAHAASEYVSFIVLLGALFTISGGILVTGDIRATPRNNTLLLLTGGVLANLIGTTGASMLLIRPLLRINSERKRTFHTVIFFIFIVSNSGGCLTPLGDPPLYLGFLEGVPFAWTLGLWREWAFVLAALLSVYAALDSVQHRREAPEDVRLDETRIEPIRVEGLHNLLYLGGVMAAVLLPGLLGLPGVVQVAGLAAMAALSLRTTPPGLRARNSFGFAPLVEVAVLFAGIFVAMVPALQYLQVHGSGLGLRRPWQFFFATGALSSFLDNAPTYLTFLSVAAGLHAAAPSSVEVLTTVRGDVPADLLRAVSLGAVFMGANSYIGNGPNFMVKAIAEGSGLRMPSFFGYMAWSAAILLPLFAVVAVVFL